MLVLIEPPMSESSAPTQLFSIAVRPTSHRPAMAFVTLSSVCGGQLLKQSLEELWVTSEVQCAGSPLCRTEDVGLGLWPTQ